MRNIYTMLLWLFLPFMAHAAEPVVLSIDSQEAFDAWKFVDANDDGKTWYYDASVGGARYDYSSSYAANDWLISPSVVLEAGKSYEITGYVQIPKSMKETFMFTIGRDASVGAQSTVILSEQEVSGSQSSYKAYTATYTPGISGDYNLAIKATSPRNRYYIYFQKFVVAEKVELPGNVTDLTVTTGDEGALTATLSWKWPLLNSDGMSMGSGIKGAKIYRTDSSWASVGDGICVATLSEEGLVAGGEYTYVDKEVPKAGNYYYYVRVIGENGESPTYASAAKTWIGPDELSGISGLKAVASDDMMSVTLSWSGPAKNGGYVDMTDAGYRITRTSATTGVETVVEELWKGTSPYTDSGIAARDNYKYTVTFTHPGLTSASKQTVKVMAGTKGDMPYVNNLTYSYYFDNNGADLVSLFHVNGTRDWSKDSSGMYVYYSGTDAWFVTPALALSSGKVYELTFDTKAGSAYYTRDLGVYIGSKADKDNLPTVNLFSESVSATSFATRTVYFSVENDGEYYVAFNGKASSGTSTSYSLYVKNLSVKEVVIVPGAVTDLEASAGTEGALTARLSWVNPEVNNAGAIISVIDRVEVSRNGTVVKSYDEVAPGQAMTFDDVLLTAGEYTYSVAAYLGDNAGESIETGLWIGPDVPEAPQNVAVSVSDDVPTISWSAVVAGVHGGYVDATAVRYTVRRDEVVVAENIEATEWIDEGTVSLPLGRYVYDVTANYAGNDSEATAAAAVVLGGALALPYEPDFKDAATFDLWTLDGWAFNADKQCLRASKTESWAFTPPFMALDGTILVDFTQTAYSGRYPMKLYVYLAKDTTEDPEAHVLLRDEANDRDYFLHESSYGSNAVSLTVPVTDLKYHIGFRVLDNTMYGYLNDVRINQGVTTGIDGVDADVTGGDARYYNLQGVEVHGDPAPGLYIVKRGDITEKILVK